MTDGSRKWMGRAKAGGEKWATTSRQMRAKSKQQYNFGPAEPLLATQLLLRGFARGLTLPDLEKTLVRNSFP